MASEFLKKKAQERAETIEKTYGSTAYGASEFLRRKAGVSTEGKNNQSASVQQDRVRPSSSATDAPSAQSALSEVRGAIERQEAARENAKGAGPFQAAFSSIRSNIEAARQDPEQMESNLRGKALYLQLTDTAVGLSNMAAQKAAAKRQQTETEYESVMRGRNAYQEIINSPTASFAEKERARASLNLLPIGTVSRNREQAEREFQSASSALEAGKARRQSILEDYDKTRETYLTRMSQGKNRAERLETEAAEKREQAGTYTSPTVIGDLTSRAGALEESAARERQNYARYLSATKGQEAAREYLSGQDEGAKREASSYVDKALSTIGGTAANLFSGYAGSPLVLLSRLMEIPEDAIYAITGDERFNQDARPEGRNSVALRSADQFSAEAQKLKERAGTLGGMIVDTGYAAGNMLSAHAIAGMGTAALGGTGLVSKLESIADSSPLLTSPAARAGARAGAMIAREVIANPGNLGVSFGSAVNSYSEALANGATFEQAMQNGLTKGLAEYFSNKLFSGTPFEDAPGEKGYVTQVIERIAEGLGKSDALRSFNESTGGRVLNWLFDKAGEGLEEVVTGIADPIIDRITYDPNADWRPKLDSLLDEFTGGVLLSLLMTGGEAAVNKLMGSPTERVIVDELEKAGISRDAAKQQAKMLAKALQAAKDTEDALAEAGAEADAAGETNAARAAAEKESGQTQAETPAEPETRTAPATQQGENAPTQVTTPPAQTAREEAPAALQMALDKLSAGEELSLNDARRVIEDEAATQVLRDAGVLPESVRTDSAGRQQIRQAIEQYAAEHREETPAQPGLRLPTAEETLTEAPEQVNLLAQTRTEANENGQQTETPDRATAETAGEQQPQTSFRERARAAAETQRSREILDREERRSGLGRFLAEYRANRAQRRAESQFDEQDRRANSLRNQAEARNLTFTSAAEQGVPGGTEDQTFQVMPADMLDRNMRTAQQEAAKNGIDLRFMIGQGRVNDSSGDYNFRGWISADGKRMLIQADHSKLTWQQILDHEELHKLIKSAPGYRQAVEDALLSDARLQPYLSSIVDRYAEAYNSLGVTDENEIIEELLADYRAGFDMLDIARGRAGDVRTKATARKDIRAVEKRVQNNQPVSVEETAKASREITPEQDTDYMAAVESGDMDTAQRMVDEAAEKAGYTVKAYHGTTDDFTKFSRGEQGRNHDGYLEFGGGFYFTPNENEAREWVRRGRSGLYGKAEPKVMSVYLSPRNIINADEPIPRGAEALQRMGMSKAEANFIAGRTYRFINYLAEDKGFSNTEIQDELKSLGYDAIDATYRNAASGQYVVFDPDQIKSADPVTYDDQGNVIPLSERFNTQDDDIRFSREIDDEYIAAVESGEEWKAERMVRDAALAWGAETNENGKPLDLYHGTPRFGFTTYDMDRETASKGMIYTTTKREVSANYAGRDHYAGTRPIGTRFIENAIGTKDIIQNAKSVYQSDYHVMTEAERAKVREKVETDVNALMERYEALKDRDKLFQWDDEDYTFTNALAWVEDLFYTIQGNRENYSSAEEYREALNDDLERFERNLERVRNYLSEHYKELRGTDAYRFLTGYDVFDLYVDIAESYRKVLSDGELIQNKAGNIQVPAEMQKAMDGIHNIGAYHLYGNLGQNPATVDAEHRDWLTVKAPDIMGDDKYHSTDAIAKKAMEQGYTGLVVKNVYDGGMEADDYIFFNANQVKSADPVTYDDDGQVIPLSERFNPEDQDIRYSREIDPQEIAKAEYLTEQRRAGRTGGRGRKKVSRVRTHAYELGGLYNEVEAQMAETQPGEFTYDPISEKRSMDEALGRLRKDFTGEAKKLSDAAEWGGSDLDTAMGILHQYRQIGRDTGDYSLFNEWSHVIQEKGTKGGQFVQAFAKYSRTATERARKAAEDLREQAGKLTPTEQKRVQGHVDELLGAIDGATEEAAREAVEGQKGLQLPTATGDNQKTKDALNIIKEIHNIFALRNSNSHGVPVEDWTAEAGDQLAGKIASRLNGTSSKTQTTMQTILSDLVTFAQEHALPTQEARQHRTALDRITDYLNNREAYAEAWDEAKQVLRDMYADDGEKLEALESFLNATISYNGEDFDRTMYRAILESADLLGMSKQDILDLAAAGTTESVIDRIAGEFIKRVGTDDANLRDTVARHIGNLVRENNVNARLERMENRASKALDIKLQQLLRESRRTKADAANAIAQYLINGLDISSTDAAIAADHIAGHYMDRLNQRANRELERMFAERGERLKPKQRDKLLDLIRLGGLTNANVEDAVVDTLGLGKLSRAKQREITATMAQFADTLDAIEDNDPEGLRSLIRQQAAARNTKLDRMAEKVLSGETDVEYLRNLAMAQLDLIAADYKPRTAGEKISTVQIISHLLNARTAMRNLTSNQAFDMVDSLANNVGLLPDIIMGAITGQRSVGLNKSWASQQKRQGAIKGAGRNLLEIALDAAPNDRNQSKYGTGGRRTFSMASSGTAGKILSQAERILGYELNTTDEFHKGSVYGETMESLARFVDRGDMTVEQAAEFATDMAMYRSFQDSTVIGSILGGLKDVLNIIGTGTTNGKTIKGLPVHDFGLGDLVVKYTQVPGALIHRAIEFSPVGYLKAIYNIAQLGNLKSKGESTLAKQRAAALSIGRATTGTGLITLFALLAKAGLLRRKDDEKDKNAAALRQSQGFNGTQLNVSALGRMLSGGSLDVQEGDVLADIGFLEPLDSLMTIAALAVNDPEIKAMDLYDMFRNPKTAGKMGEKSLQGIWLALEDTSAMQTLSNIYSTVRYHDEANDLPLYMQIPMEIAASSVSGFIPAPIRQIAQATDTVYRDQYRSQNLLDQTAAKVANAIPGVRQQLAPKLTPLGEEKSYQAPALNALNALLSPGNISVYHSTAVTDEFLRVYDETGEAKILPERNAPYSITINNEKYTLTPDERTQYQETRGKVTTQFADAVRKSKWYKALPADEQAEVLNWCGNFANYVAKTAFMTERGDEYTSKTYAKYYDEWQSGASPADVAAKANKQNPDGTASRSVPTLKLPTA